MATKYPFGSVDMDEVERVKQSILTAGAQHVDTMRTRLQLEQDLRDKDKATMAFNGYVNALKPAQVKRYNYATGEAKNVLEFPSDQEILAAASEARSRLTGGGRHSERALVQIDSDLTARSKFIKKASDPKRAELDYYIDQFGLELGLQKYNEIQQQRIVTKAEVEGTQDVRVEAARTRGKLAVEREKPGFSTAGSPQQLKSGNIGIPWINKRTGATGLYDTGMEFMPKAAAGSSGKGLSDSMSAAAAFEDELNAYERLLAQVDDGRIGGTVEKAKALVGLQDSARAAGGYQESLASSGARVINGERGVLTNQDVERAKLLIPLITDTISERELKFSLLKELLAKRKEAFRSGYDGAIHTTSLSDSKYAPKYPDIGWDEEDSAEYFKEFKHWPSYNDAITAMTGLQRSGAR